jgi:undecaprenyl diphosphate synthase
MDGNRRWAKERGLDSLEGHREGYETLKKILRGVRDRGIWHAIFYAFSTENWGRSDEEVTYLMELFKEALTSILKDLEKDKVRVRIVGERERFSKELQSLMYELEEKSAPYVGTTIWLALSYGGRAEIVDAVNCAVEGGEQVTEASFGKLLWTKDMPDPDLIIRTGGELRLSNFLPWQSVYSELFFTKTYWPDFGKEEFERMLEQYAERDRRKGA